MGLVREPRHHHHHHQRRRRAKRLVVAKNALVIIFFVVIVERLRNMWGATVVVVNPATNPLTTTSVVVGGGGVIPVKDFSNHHSENSSNTGRQTAAYLGCSGHESLVDPSKEYDGHVTASCVTFGYKAPLEVMESSSFTTTTSNNDNDRKESRTRPVRLVVGVLSNNATMRGAIRQTWGSSLRKGRQLYFLVATREFASIQSEYQTKQDILWLDMKNSYHNLTYMTAAMLTILHRHVPSYTHLLKTDDDCYVHTHRMTAHLQQLLLQQNASPPPHNVVVHYTGHIPKLLTPMRDTIGIKEQYKKFVLTTEEYPAPEFPLYASGSGYVLTPTLNECIIRQAQTIRFMKFEDVYVGMLAQRCGHTCHDQDRFVGSIDTRWNFEKAKNLSDSVLLQHGMTYTDNLMHKYHNHPRASFFRLSTKTAASANCQPVLATSTNDDDTPTARVSCETFRYLVSETLQNATQPHELLFFVMGSGNQKQRRAVRESWAKGLRVFFLVNSPDFATYQDEFNDVGDLFWIEAADPRDSPVRLIQAAVQAVHQRRTPFRYLVFVHVKTYLHVDRFNETVTGDLFGSCVKAWTINPTIRKRKPEKLSTDMYPEPYLPPRCVDPGFAMSPTLVDCAATESQTIRYHPSVDIAMGMLTMRCGGWTHNAPNALPKEQNTTNVLMIPNSLGKMMLEPKQK